MSPGEGWGGAWGSDLAGGRLLAGSWEFLFWAPRAGSYESQVPGFPLPRQTTEGSVFNEIGHREGVATCQEPKEAGRAVGGGKGGRMSGAVEERSPEEAGMAEANAERRRDGRHGYSCGGGSQTGWQTVPSKHTR